MFKKVLIANRGAIACRIMRTLRKLGVQSVAVYTRADVESLHVRQADEAMLIGDGPAAKSYLDIGKILDVAQRTGAEAIHPGYGFLSENTAFAEACEGRGIRFMGPTPAQIRAFGLKHVARELAERSRVPLAPGSGLLENMETALLTAEQIGYPVMLKSTAGGGGIGMQRCYDAQQLAGAYASVERLSRNNFGNSALFLEKYIERARHIEVQVFGDGNGEVLALGERDCSIQRRNQKVIEETPAPNLPEEVRAALRETAVKLMAQVDYRSAGTVEYIYDSDTELFYFLEVNTRLQVEHGVTEEIFGVDIVEWMVKLAAGEMPALADIRPRLVPRGHAVQARLYAEDPGMEFRPSTGLLTEVVLPAADGLRIDGWIEAGVTVPAFYDPMLAKLIVRGDSRAAALDGLKHALAQTRVAGIETNRDYLRTILDQPAFRDGHPYTRLLENLAYAPASIDVIDGGTLTTVQDHPGRIGYWNVGIPPSGPFDDYSFRLGNRLLNNAPEAAGLEITVNGPTLRFNCNARIVLAGAAMHAEIDGREVPFWQATDIGAGSTLHIRGLLAGGARAYLCVAGGLDVPGYLGSRATFTLGGFGGHGGRALRAGDVLHVQTPHALAPPPLAASSIRPVITDCWELRVVYGPHGAPDFFTDADIAMFFATDWEVHYNSSRTGIRLIGPKPQWARKDGGEAGLHPSNIHDNAYAVGTVDFTGDMPIILGPDGPSLGGFVCPATVILADLWKLGQMKAGNKVRFVPVSREEAVRIDAARERLIEELQGEIDGYTRAPVTTPVLRRREADARQPAVVYRPSGEDYLLVEFGPLVLDIALRARVHAWMLWLEARRPAGIVDLTPGIRSLQIHYDWRVLPLRRLMALLEQAEEELADIGDLHVPSRIVHLPLSWDDPSTQLAIEKYMQSVRKDAPWCPSNIEFIRRINGLASIEEVRRIVFEASYLVLGLGDVYLGAPVATPLDPRHRLVTTKYNPARTWTPENAVGIGGAYLCIYGMEGPGGYQFVGRTVQMWNRFRATREFSQPWLLRFFDQIRFFPVSEQELTEIREAFPLGRYPLRIEETSFNLQDYQRFLHGNAEDIERFRACQQKAFREERERWETQGLMRFESDADAAVEDAGAAPLQDGCIELVSPVAGSLWQVSVQPGDRIKAGQVVAIVESMKMEISVSATRDGEIAELPCAVGAQLQPGRRLAVIRTR
jgi:urea carboxylase